MQPSAAGVNYLDVMGRLERGIGLAQARQEMSKLALELEAEGLQSSRGVNVAQLETLVGGELRAP